VFTGSKYIINSNEKVEAYGLLIDHLEGHRHVWILRKRSIDIDI
jgi:hypothetical protein